MKMLFPVMLKSISIMLAICGAVIEALSLVVHGQMKLLDWVHILPWCLIMLLSISLAAVALYLPASTILM
jgi:hypothetical protein